MSSFSSKSRQIVPQYTWHYDAKTQIYKGGAQVWAINGNSITLRVQTAPHSDGLRVVARSLFPAGVAVIIGEPVVAVFTGDTITAIEAGRFPGGGGPPRGDQSGTVAAGLFHPSAIFEKSYVD
jgi:hypothetical protein